MEGQASSRRGWVRPPPGEQYAVNRPTGTVQDYHHHQFEAPVRFQESNQRLAVPNVTYNPSYVSNQLPFSVGTLVPSYYPQTRQDATFGVPPFSRPPPRAVLDSSNLTATGTSSQSHPMIHQNESCGLPWDAFDYNVKIRPVGQYDFHTPCMTKPHISVESEASQNLSKQKGQDSDKKWLVKFEERVLKQQPSQVTVVSEKTAVKTGDVVRVVCEGDALVRQLVSLERQGQCCNGEEDWCHFIKQTHKLKENLRHILFRLQDDVFIQWAKILINQRRTKRKRVKRRKKDLQYEKQEKIKRRQEEETRIDAWRERLQQEVEQQKREKVVQCEADSVLGEVRQKQSEAQRLLQVLEKVSSLRKARHKKTASHGQTFSPDTDHHFTYGHARLEELVKNQLKEYELEKRTLCVMLEGTASHKSAAKGRDVSLLYENMLKKLLFGDQAPLDRATLESFTMADHCLEILAHRRQDWDRYISEGESPLASSIPPNWVLPPPNPMPGWATYHNLPT